MSAEGILIKLDSSHASCPDYLASFFRSLGVDLAQSSECGTWKPDPYSQCEFNLMKFYPGEQLLGLDEWVVSGEEIPGGHLLHINGTAVAASLQSVRAGKNSEGYLVYETKVTLEAFVKSLSPSVRHLSLYACASITDLAPIAGLHDLRSLHLAYCKGVKDLSAIASLDLVESLDLSDFDWMPNLEVIANLRSLRRLVLDRCQSLEDLSGLQSLRSLAHLNLWDCQSVDKLTCLNGLDCLRTLNLYGCRKISDFSPVGSLRGLRKLDISGHDNFNDLSVLSNLTQLTRLNLSRKSWSLSPSSPESLACLASLRKLSFLRAENWVALHDIGALRDMLQLRELDLSNAKKLTDLSPLSGLESLETLVINGCRSLKDLSPLAKISSLKTMAWGDNGCANLSRSEALEDLRPLASLKWIKKLDLSESQSIRNIAPLGDLDDLEELNLKGCSLISDISTLSRNQKLRKVELLGLKRLKSLEGLKNLKELREIESDLHPGLVVGIIAHAATVRRDTDMIRKQGGTWGREAQNYEKDADPALEALVTVICAAYTLLGEDLWVAPTEALLNRHPEFSSSPWSAWFRGTLAESGFDVYRRRVERVPLAKMSIGAVGGACLTLPLEKQAEWSRQWLADLEKSRVIDAKVLLPVAPEICVAYARSGDKEALRRWLEKFTDPSDPPVLDPVHVALAKFQLLRGDLDSAANHLHAIQSPAARDPVLGELVVHLAERDEDLASGSLLLIEDQALRLDLAKHLAAMPTASESSIYRCVVAAGESPQALADLISSLPSSSRSELLIKLSKQLQRDRKNILLKIAQELESQAALFRAKAIGE